jgi:DNA-binding NarL/FixJ family response regulator
MVVSKTGQQTDKLIQVVIIEDNRFIRQGWELTLNSAPGMQVSAAYESCEKAFAGDAIEFADIVLMDIGLPGMSGIEGVKYLKERFPNLTIVMCSVNEDDSHIFDAICAGAVGYLLKRTSPQDLIAALKEAHQGGSPMTPSVARKVIASFQNSKTTSLAPEDRLTVREQDILRLMTVGKTYTTIAAELFLSVDGVYYHIRHIYEKLQVHSRSEAIAEGMRRKIIQPPR